MLSAAGLKPFAESKEVNFVISKIGLACLSTDAVLSTLRWDYRELPFCTM